MFEPNNENWENLNRYFLVRGQKFLNDTGSEEPANNQESWRERERETLFALFETFPRKSKLVIKLGPVPAMHAKSAVLLALSWRKIGNF